MMWWIKARRVPSFLTGSLLGFVLFSLLTQDTSIPVPSFSSGGSAEVRLVMFVPMPLVVGLMMMLDSRASAPEASSVRLVEAMDIALATVTVLLAGGIGFTLASLVNSSALATLGRNTLFLTGLMLLGRIAVRSAAAMIPVAWLFVVLFVGFRTSNDPYFWAIIPDPWTAPHATAVAFFVFIVGVCSILRTSRTA